jgi:ribonuclease T2
MSGRQAAFIAAVGLIASSAIASHHHDPEAGMAGQFDYYLLSLSWSPSYCLLHPGDEAECHRRGYGFVLHGLWPQYDAGGYPQNCATSVTLTAEASALARTIFPSQRLVEHEWQRHGTCSGLDALSYFRSADTALTAVQVPERFAAPRSDQQLAGAEILSAFIAANPGVPTSALSLSCSRGQLSEVHVCLNRELKLRACTQRTTRRCASAPLQIPAVR